MVYCVYSLESSRLGDSNENTQHTFMLKKFENIFLLCLLIWKYPCFEHVFLVPKVFEPLKFYLLKKNAKTENSKFAYSFDPDDEAHNEPPLLDLHCLPSSFRVLNMI